MITDRYPHGAPCWVEIVAPDGDAITAFYGGLFGWSFAGGIARLEGLAVAGVGAPGRAGWRTYVRVRRASAVAAAVVEGGGWVLPDHLYADPDGAVFGVMDTGVGAEAVNRPGAWNWSILRTPSADGAGTFYGPLFGWDIASEGGARMVRLPGYGDVLELIEPGILERHRAFGAPEGFTDAVAWVIPSPERARWDVTFAVADADDVADRAVDLGADVLIEPRDEGRARVAELRDPQGARFTVSAYVL